MFVPPICTDNDSDDAWSDLSSLDQIDCDEESELDDYEWIKWCDVQSPVRSLLFDDDVDSATDTATIKEKEKENDLISKNEPICFDKVSITASEALEAEVFHRWDIHILSDNAGIQGIEVVSTDKVHRIDVNKHGVKETNESGTRYIYEFGSDGRTKSECMDWKIGDVITVSLDIKACRVTFALNGHQI